MASPKVRPLGDKVLVKPCDEEDTSAGGIVLPDSAKEKPQEGTILAVGDGKLLDSGERAAVTVKVGDRVIYSKYGGTEVTIDGEDYLLMDEGSLLAVRE
ncbi:MAG: co-chaperone GroES [Armatimonadetes bacterium CG_4_10_14_3_um_filter_66_18]|nr:co-chaperone GroES [Armatimonadota bacterium]OIP01892.1 MAG: co-chaperone GroES [Armatimonadetes bacterium CG2_30_66_41]PIU92276.1 MAG: co-chaperone GroES [Armatimonadetes bacterium CG06_land_8_20_14_3_00_66_21]PIW18920.1 MAG: co-chaperone GroES [Armatimonadetes bacterium CG17_big_fil_post_rev_8_21_14_2_50_66_6]PIX40440.1 MAG: co-chaperone GroES [Armatimonadetes bacterium CG_4_8_14_3_um_filter_66_20]PIY43375.1 MAG: co-chaperone GroES [Armatimonadetes bacterium CG_4_10_14_3_um_filter_66_18]